MAKKSKMLKVDRSTVLKRNIALYLRVSTDRQAEEGYSIEIQKERLKAFVFAKYPDAEIEYFVDDGYSGGSLERPEMERLMEKVRNHEITDVIVYKLDRLSRSQKDTLYLIEDVFLANNVAFSSLQESFDTSTAFGRAVVGILSVFAQLERENIYERTRSGMKKRVESGLWPGGGNVPFGYDYDKNLGYLVPNKDAATLKQLFEDYMSGMSTQKLAKIYGFVYDNAVYQILTRRTYLGKTVYNGVEYDGCHKALISQELFDAVQRRLEDRKKRGHPINPNYLLSSIVYCMECGAKMRYLSFGKCGIKLVCYSQQTYKPYLVKDPDCKNAKPWADEVEAAVIENMFQFANDIQDIEPVGEKKVTHLESLQMQKAGAETRRSRVIKLFTISDDAMMAELQAQIKDINDEIKFIESQIKQEQERKVVVGEAEDIKSRMKSIKTLWPKMTNVQKQEFIREAIDKVEVGVDRIHVSYRF